MPQVIACFTTSHTDVGSSKKENKFPPRPVKNQVTIKSVCEDTFKRYPRIMAELAK